MRVNAIAPGVFPDAYAMTEAEWQGRITAGAPGVPLNRVGHPREVGLMAIFLASNAASYVTGQTFVIDGGRTLLEISWIAFIHTETPSGSPSPISERGPEGEVSGGPT